jgi:hypothetical protein
MSYDDDDDMIPPTTRREKLVAITLIAVVSIGVLVIALTGGNS